MAEMTIILNEWNGTVLAQGATNKTNEAIRFKSADSPVVDNDNPLLRPNAGVFRSCEKWLRLQIVDVGDSTAISNIEVYTTGAVAMGTSIWARTVATYCDAVGDIEADQIDPLGGGYASAGAMPQPKTNLFDALSDAPLSLGEGPYEENSDDGVGIDGAGIGLYLVLQMEVYPTATVGANDSYDLIFRYDEE